MSYAIAIVGMACRYADALSPVELWENALAQRRAFRQMPPERLRLEDYLPSEGNNLDTIYPIEVAVIGDYEFDRVKFRVAGSTYRSADLAHWLALDIASQALADAGFSDAEGLPRQSTGVILGNTLTGEFSRASIMRLRWPYVRRVVGAALARAGLSLAQQADFLHNLESEYKKPFPVLGEESLAGGLSNTIAGRICNHFDLKGGGYTVDGACASSLLAVTTACSALAAGDLDVALTGGVDLSLDPFELVGFAKTSALASEEMRVYDARSNGFWPGEGCGFVVLMRQEDALAQGRKIYALIRGWGVSSDGSGGLTRPEVEGQTIALERAYRKARFGIDTVTYFEGHGTGTSVGDATELRVLTQARKEAAPDAPSAYISSIKANIGHTKAAAGIAGLIKATMAIKQEILPPATACHRPHSEFTGDSPALKVLSQGEAWPSDKPLRAGVSAMGFGGINTHVVLEGASETRRQSLDATEAALVASAQDAELILIEAADKTEMANQIDRLLEFAKKISRAELTDLAAAQQRTIQKGRVRAAVVAATPAGFAEKLELLKATLSSGVASKVDTRSGIFLGGLGRAPRIGFLFPGQGSPAHLTGGIWRRRFAEVRKLYADADLPQSEDGTSTQIAQPAIITSSLASVQILSKLGINGDVAVGHSLGELAAIWWAGGFDESALLRIAKARGKVMAELGSPTGAMASVRAGRKEIEANLNGYQVVIAGLNAPRQTVISGDATDLKKFLERLDAAGLSAVRLPVSHAFHSPCVSAAAPAFDEFLGRESFNPIRGKVFSTVTGDALDTDTNLRELFVRQITSPVRFEEAVTRAAEEIDLFLETGPGGILTGLVSDYIGAPVISLDSGGSSLVGLLKAVGAAYAMGVPVDHGFLFNGRFTRPFNLDRLPQFFVNPCELAPLPDGLDAVRKYAQDVIGDEVEEKTVEDNRAALAGEGQPASVLEMVRELVAKRVELPASVVKDTNRLLSDLHLNSITVSQIIGEASRILGLRRPFSPTDYADATVGEVARVLEEMSSTGSSAEGEDEKRAPSGIGSWIRPFTVELVRRARPRRKASHSAGQCKVFAPADYPFAELLRNRLTDVKENAVVVCLPPSPDERHLELLLEGSRAVLEEGADTRFVLVQHGGGASAFAKTLHLENPQIPVCVIDITPEESSIDLVIAEIESASGYVEAVYDSAGQRREPVLRFLEVNADAVETPLGPDDVLIVSGGGKGITAECALDIARETGCALVLLGLSEAEADEEIQINLKRLASAGIRHRYISADVTDASAIESAVKSAAEEFGPITAILHGAALNVPQPLRSMKLEYLSRTVEIKVQGARNLLAAVDDSRLKLFIGFGSIIGRTGLHGEAHYGLANEWLTRLIEEFRQSHPNCKCLSIEWSVWSGVGMAQRIGGIERLVESGITPITPDEGVSMLRRLLRSDLSVASVVVAGRYIELPTLKVEQPELPLMRFLEKPRVFYPGIELIAEAEISAESDHYLADHQFQKERLFPAVMGLEAMAQVAVALADSALPPRFENVEFARPVVVPEGRTITIRVLALQSEPGRIEVALRSEETSFAADHFRAVCVFDKQAEEIDQEIGGEAETEIASPRLEINPEKDLYGGILFHEGRFRRLGGYLKLKAKECLAEITPDGTTEWFDRFLPSRLVLADPGARDTVIHAIQACIPHATLLPIGIDSISGAASPDTEIGYVSANERKREGDTFTYDLRVLARDGCLLQKWEGLKLRKVSNGKGLDPCIEPLLGPYIERRIEELVPGARVSVAVERSDSSERRARSDKAIQQAFGSAVPLIRRFDGKPEIQAVGEVSAAHCGSLTIGVAGSTTLACDVEEVKGASQSVWTDLLGLERRELAEVIAREAAESQDQAATRVWAAAECLKKAGVIASAPVSFESWHSDGWVVLSSGRMSIVTFATKIRDLDPTIVFAFLTTSEL